MYNSDSLKSPPQALLGSTPVENVQNFLKGGPSVRNYSDMKSDNACTESFHAITSHEKTALKQCKICNIK